MSFHVTQISSGMEVSLTDKTRSSCPAHDRMQHQPRSWRSAPDFMPGVSCTGGFLDVTHNLGPRAGSDLVHNRALGGNTPATQCWSLPETLCAAPTDWCNSAGGPGRWASSTRSTIRAGPSGNTVTQRWDPHHTTRDPAPDRPNPSCRANDSNSDVLQ